MEGTLVHLAVERLPGNRDPKPPWLWHSDPDAVAHDVDRLWRIFLRRFDLEHIFRFFKQPLGLTQLRLARLLAENLRRPWEKPLVPDQLTPGWVRRGYRRVHKTVGLRPVRRKSPAPDPAGPRAAPPPATQSARNATKGHSRARQGTAAALKIKLCLRAAVKELGEGLAGGAGGEDP
ncbi:hypothetical protein GCM10010430_66440 [Kitasatospora cystarginea]|uniref:Transposase n=1 Tax=Kitasatospora cystarginea TaxID=58350 RepID=A0ABN3EV97_9ACTN